MTSTLGEMPVKKRVWPDPAAFRLMERLQNFASVTIPAVLMVGFLLLLWQMLCGQEGSSLPPPTKVLTDTWPLIVDPFFDNGGTDVGLFWQVLASLKRVAVGFSMAAVAGIA